MSCRPQFREPTELATNILHCFISPFIHVILGYPCLISETYCSRVATRVGRGQDGTLFNGCSSECIRSSQVKESDVRHHFFVQRAGIHTLRFHQEHTRVSAEIDVTMQGFFHPSHVPFHVPPLSLGTRHLHLLTYAGKLDDIVRQTAYPKIYIRHR